MRPLLLLSLAAFVIQAQEPMPKSTPKPAVGTGVNDPTVDYFDSVADHFRNSRRAVLAIRDKGIPDEEVPAILYVARNSTASPNMVIEARKAGKSWDDIVRQYNVKVGSGDFVTEANVSFLSNYHGRSETEVRAMHSKGATWIDINQELRRSGAAPKQQTR